MLPVARPTVALLDLLAGVPDDCLFQAVDGPETYTAYELRTQAVTRYDARTPDEQFAFYGRRTNDNRRVICAVRRSDGADLGPLLRELP